MYHLKTIDKVELKPISKKTLTKLTHNRRLRLAFVLNNKVDILVFSNLKSVYRQISRNRLHCVDIHNKAVGFGKK